MEREKKIANFYDVTRNVINWICGMYSIGVWFARFLWGRVFDSKTLWKRYICLQARQVTAAMVRNKLKPNRRLIEITEPLEKVSVFLIYRWKLSYAIKFEMKIFLYFNVHERDGKKHYMPILFNPTEGGWYEQLRSSDLAWNHNLRALQWNFPLHILAST